MQLDDLYRRVIMDHYKNPRNRGTFDNDAVTVNLNNPTCGDRISLQILLKDGIVRKPNIRVKALHQHVLCIDDDRGRQRQNDGTSTRYR